MLWLELDTNLKGMQLGGRQNSFIMKQPKPPKLCSSLAVKTCHLPLLSSALGKILSRLVQLGGFCNSILMREERVMGFDA